MKTALAISHGRLAPCFAGVELWIVGRDESEPTDDPTALADAEVLSTCGWHPLAWGRELALREVERLLCSGIDRSTWSSVRGHGIEVVPNAMGAVEEVWSAWRKGRLSPPKTWPACPRGFEAWPENGCGRGRGKRRFRGGGRFFGKGCSETN